MCGKIPPTITIILVIMNSYFKNVADKNHFFLTLFCINMPDLCFFLSQRNCFFLGDKRKSFIILLHEQAG